MRNGEYMTPEYVLFLLKHAIGSFYEHDQKLPKIAAHERTCVARIAIYLQQLLDQEPAAKNLRVDCEYGSMTTDTGEEFRKYMYAKSAYGTSDGKQSRVFPDLIVHERGKQDNNLLVAEFKGYWHQHSWNEDKTKLECLTADAPSKNLKPYFKYELGVFVALGRKHAYFVEFKDGQQTSTPQTIDELYNQRTSL